MNATPTIIDAHKLTLGQARYWNAQVSQLAGRVDVIDPWRHSLRDLRDMGYTGQKVYRASTGGKYGKSSQIRTV